MELPALPLEPGLSQQAPPPVRRQEPAVQGQVAWQPSPLGRVSGRVGSASRGSGRRPSRRRGGPGALGAGHAAGLSAPLDGPLERGDGRGCRDCVIAMPRPAHGSLMRPARLAASGHCQVHRSRLPATPRLPMRARTLKASRASSSPCASGVALPAGPAAAPVARPDPGRCGPCGRRRAAQGRRSRQPRRPR